MDARGYLNDLEYGRMIVERRVQGKGYGRHVAWQELRRKGIDADVARCLVDEIGDQEELQVAMEVARSKKRVLEKRSLPGTHRLTVGRHLERRGFPAHIVQGVLEELFPYSEDV